MNFSSARPTIPGRPGLHKPAANQGLAFGKALEEAEIHWLVACVIKRVACLGSRSGMASRWKWLLGDIRWMHETYVLIVYSLVLGKSKIMSVVSIQITLRSWPHGEQWYATMDLNYPLPQQRFPNQDSHQCFQSYHYSHCSPHHMFVFISRRDNIGECWANRANLHIIYLISYYLQFEFVLLVQSSCCSFSPCSLLFQIIT